MKVGVRLAAIALGGLATLGTGVAYAASGDYVQQNGKLVFFYGHSSGNADGYHILAGGSTRQCLDAPGSSAYTMFVSALKKQVAFATDPTLQTASAYYRDPTKYTAYVSTSSTAKYYPHVTWNYTSASGYNANGYGAIEC